MKRMIPRRYASYDRWKLLRSNIRLSLHLKSKHVGASRRTPPGRDAEVMLPGPGRAQVQSGLSLLGEPRALQSASRDPFALAHRVGTHARSSVARSRAQHHAHSLARWQRGPVNDRFLVPGTAASFRYGDREQRDRAEHLIQEARSPETEPALLDPKATATDWDAAFNSVRSCQHWPARLHGFRVDVRPVRLEDDGHPLYTAAALHRYRARAGQLGCVVLPGLCQAGDQLGALDGHGRSIGGPKSIAHLLAGPAEKPELKPATSATVPPLQRRAYRQGGCLGEVASAAEQARGKANGFTRLQSIHMINASLLGAVDYSPRNSRVWCTRRKIPLADASVICRVDAL